MSLNKKPIEQYSHQDKERLNNPTVGLVSDVTDVDYGQKRKSMNMTLISILNYSGLAKNDFYIPSGRV